MKNDIEKKIGDFLLNRVMPLITDELEEGYPLKANLIGTRKGSIFNEMNYKPYLTQFFGSTWNVKGCKCINKVVENRGLNLIQLLIFIAKHDIDFCDNAGHYGYGGCYFKLGVARGSCTYVNMDILMHSNLLRETLTTPVRAAFTFLKGKYCTKKYKYCPARYDFEYEYWKMQAELFFKNLPPLSNRGCSNKKSGITYNEECKDCILFKNDKWGVCEFDYLEEYGRYLVLLLPDNGKTYACKHFDKTNSRIEYVNNNRKVKRNACD